MQILMIHDVMGRPGRTTLQALLSKLKEELRVDLVVANGENIVSGFSLTLDTSNQLFDSVVYVITSGHHVWYQEKIVPYLNDRTPILRPLNYPNTEPGESYLKLDSNMIMNLIGRVFVNTFDCPFRAVGQLLEKSVNHPNVATTDARILPKGTAFVNDVGMVGSINSIIGANPDDALQRFTDQKPRRLSVAIGGPTKFNSVQLDIDETTGRAIKIRQVDREIE